MRFRLPPETAAGSRNQRTATAIQPYSARARPGMPAAAPVDWDKLEVIEGSDAFTMAKSRGVKGLAEGGVWLLRLR